MIESSNERKKKRDWRISATLAAVWLIALAIVINSGTVIPASMLVIATAFFVLLIPSMNDLVQSIERVSGKSPETKDDNRNSEHECER